MSRDDTASRDFARSLRSDRQPTGEAISGPGSGVAERGGGGGEVSRGDNSLDHNESLFATEGGSNHESAKRYADGEPRDDCDEALARKTRCVSNRGRRRTTADSRRSLLPSPEHVSPQ